MSTFFATLSRTFMGASLDVKEFVPEGVKVRDIWAEDEDLAEKFREQIQPTKMEVVKGLDEAMAGMKGEVEHLSDLEKHCKTLSEIKIPALLKFVADSKKFMADQRKAYNKYEDVDIPNAVKEIQQLCDDLDNHRYLNGPTQFRSNSGRYVQQVKNTLNAKSFNRRAKETIFKVKVTHSHPVKLTMKADPGYVLAKSGKSVLDRKRDFTFTELANAQNEFLVIFIDEKTVCFRTEHELWFSADADGNMEQSGNLDEHQKFNCDAFFERRTKLIEQIEKRIKQFRDDGLAFIPKVLEVKSRKRHGSAF
eukprot:CAMPEP_0114517802 /NCGR_PEP_ID=MMETSP0109-20121206/18094_1 /TAXON_ID=29199 /ORGANISM="Chlorarachnion reptans, Strain CCCM449" /LENGTH=306 /DNA_ID=CAMNT_0001698359 /DNA_START=50 /DNA_END=970 /DNA_ORIENTATION=-